MSVSLEAVARKLVPFTLQDSITKLFVDAEGVVEKSSR